MPANTDRVLRFAEFEIDRDALELRRDGARVHLQIQPFRVLEALIEAGGGVVSRDELRNRIWPAKVYVDFDHGLNNAVARLREALGDSPDNPKYIETLPRVGYRFVFPAEKIQGSPPAAANPATATTASGSRRRFIVAVLLIAFATTAIIVIDNARRPPGGSVSSIRSIAVLPVRNLSGEPDQDPIAAGMTDALVTRLAQSASLRVVSRRSGERFRDAAMPLADIARELEVDGVIESSLLRHGDKLRMDVQLVRAADDSHAWAKSYDRTVRDVFQLQRELANDIANEISGGGATRRPAVSVAFSNDLDAYELYLQGRHLLNQRSPESVTKSLEFFRTAIDLDADFAAAHAGLAESYALLGGSSLVKTLRIDDVREPALAAAQRSLELDELLPEAHLAMARATDLQPRSDETNREIEEHYGQALSLNPAYSEAMLAYGNFLSARARYDEAIAMFRDAVLHDPLSPNSISRLGKELVDNGHIEEGIQLVERAVEIEPWQFNSHLRLAWTYAAFSRYDEAQQSFAKAEQITPGTIHTLAGQAFVAALRGDSATATRILETLHAQSGTLDLPQLIAQVYVALRDREHALEWLEIAAPDQSSRHLHGAYGLDSSFYDWLRDDPRFLRVVQTVASNP